LRCSWFLDTVAWHVRNFVLVLVLVLVLGLLLASIV
jgi:hypothetical protein